MFPNDLLPLITACSALAAMLMGIIVNLDIPERLKFLRRALVVMFSLLPIALLSYRMFIPIPAPLVAPYAHFWLSSHTSAFCPVKDCLGRGAMAFKLKILNPSETPIDKVEYNAATQIVDVKSDLKSQAAEESKNFEEFRNGNHKSSGLKFIRESGAMLSINVPSGSLSAQLVGTIEDENQKTLEQKCSSPDSIYDFCTVEFNPTIQHKLKNEMARMYVYALIRYTDTSGSKYERSYCGFVSNTDTRVGLPLLRNCADNNRIRKL